MKYRSRLRVVDAERIDNHGWIVTGEDGKAQRIPEHIFLNEYEVVPVVKKVMSRSAPQEDFVAILFDGTSTGMRMESLDNIRRWDPDNDWDSTSDTVNRIVSGCGTYWIPSGYWMIFRGKEFLYPCTPDYFAERFILIEE